MVEFDDLRTHAERLFKRYPQLVEVMNPAHEIPLFTPYQSTSDADGATDGTTILDSALTVDYDAYRVYIMDKDSSRCNEERTIDADTSSGTIHVSSAFGDQIVSGTSYWINGIAIRDTNAHASDKAIDMRLLNYLQIFIDNQLSVDVSIQLYGNRIESTAAGAITLGPAFNVATLDQEARFIEASVDPWVPWIWIEATCPTGGAGTTGILFAYALAMSV